MEGEISYVETSILELYEFLNAATNQIQKIQEAEEISGHVHKIDIVSHAINMFSEIDKEEKFQKEIIQFPINLGKFEVISFQNKYGKLKQNLIGKLKILESQIRRMKPNVISQTLKSVKVLKSSFQTFLTIKPLQRDRFWTNAELPNSESTKYLVGMDNILVDGIIGKGGYGKVYKGKYKGQIVAVKSINIIHQKHKAFLERELDVISKLHHPNILQFVGICRVKETIYLLTEIVVYGELTNFMRYGAIPANNWKIREKIGLESAAAISFMHSKNIIHNDIKPENLLIDKDWDCKLCDFGFARFTETGILNDQKMLGTEYFCAPEKMKCNPYSYSVDTFAWGVCMLELITLASIGLDREKKNDYQFDWENIFEAIPSDCPSNFKQVAIQSCEYNEKLRPEIFDVEKEMKMIYENDLQDLPPLSSQLLIVDVESLDGKKPKRATMIGQVVNFDKETIIKRDRPMSIYSKKGQTHDLDNPNNNRITENKNIQKTSENLKNSNKKTENNMYRNTINLNEEKEDKIEENLDKKPMNKMSENIMSEIQNSEKKKQLSTIKIDSKDGSGSFLIPKIIYESDFVKKNNEKKIRRPTYSSQLSSTNLDNQKDEIIAQINNEFVIPNSYLVINIKLISSDEHSVFTLQKTKIRLFKAASEKNEKKNLIVELLVPDNKVFVTKKNQFYLAFKVPQDLSTRDRNSDKNGNFKKNVNDDPNGRKYNLIITTLPKKNSLPVDKVSVNIQLSVVDDPFFVYKKSPSQVFFTPLNVVNLRECLSVPRVVSDTISYFHQNLHLFFDNLASSKIPEKLQPSEFEVGWIISLYDSGKPVQLSSIQSPYSMVEVLRTFLYSMPEPLCSLSMFKPFSKVSTHENIEKRLYYYKKIFSCMDDTRSKLLNALFRFFYDLYVISGHVNDINKLICWKKNQASYFPAIISLILAPSSFLRPLSDRNLNSQDTACAEQVLNDLICNFDYFQKIELLK